MREGVKGRLESFRKIIRFGSPKRPFKACLLNSDYLISPTIYSYRKQDKKWEKWNVVPSCWCPYLDQIRWICHRFHTSGQIQCRKKKEKSTAINRCSCLSSVGQWRCVKIESKLVYLSRYLAPLPFLELELVQTESWSLSWVFFFQEYSLSLVIGSLHWLSIFPYLDNKET